MESHAQYLSRLRFKAIRKHDGIFFSFHNTFIEVELTYSAVLVSGV